MSKSIDVTDPIIETQRKDMTVHVLEDFGVRKAGVEVVVHVRFDAGMSDSDKVQLIKSMLVAIKDAVRDRDTVEVWLNGTDTAPGRGG